MWRWWVISILYYVLREGLTDQVSFEHRPEGSQAMQIFGENHSRQRGKQVQRLPGRRVPSMFEDRSWLLEVPQCLGFSGLVCKESDDNRTHLIGVIGR